MGVTISADGLSIVHQDSGGEANATLPDVCNTTMGNSVVPIPYGNNAKSTDLADGTTTVTADGGNSIALKDSMFSCSTGDAGGDKKGVSSGTIEAEAKFISASPTVKFEGKGVARLSDQMTMNAGNTMCMGGCNNPSVTVTPDEEGTYTVDIHCRYPNGAPLDGASFTLKDTSGSVLAEGTLDASGKAEVGGLENAQYTIEYGEHNGAFTVNESRCANPVCEKLDDDRFFDIASNTEQPFWVPAGKITHHSWGYVGKSLSDSNEIRHMLTTETTTSSERHLTVDQSFLIAGSLLALFDIQTENDEVLPTLIESIAPLVDDNGEVFTLFVHFHKEESGDNLLAALRAQGTGNPADFLDNLDWGGMATAISALCLTILERVIDRLATIEFHASIRNHAWVADNAKAHGKALSEVSQTLPDQISEAVTLLKDKVATIQANGAPAMVVKKMATGHSTTVGKRADIVHILNGLPKPLEICLAYDDIERTPAKGVPYKVAFANGEERAGFLDMAGVARLVGVPQVGADIEFGDPDEEKKAAEALKTNYDDLDSTIQTMAEDLAEETRLKLATTTLTPEEQEIYLLARAAIEEELSALKQRSDDFSDLSFFEQSWEHLKSVAVGAGKSVTEYIPDLGPFGDLMDEADIGIGILMDAIATGDIDVLQRKLNAINRDALGLTEASEAMEILIILLSDPVSREYIASLPRRFMEAMSPDDLTQLTFTQGGQKVIDIGMVKGGTALGTLGGGVAGALGGPPGAAAGASVGGTASATVLIGVAASRNLGKVAEATIRSLKPIIDNHKIILNRHKKKPHEKDNETNLPKYCPICDDERCKNRKRKKKGKGYTDRKGSRHTENMKKANPGYPKTHEWFAGGRTVAAHHVIPVEAVKDDPDFEDAFDDFSFDINTVDNLVSLPMRPALACELRVQCHYTNHDEGIALEQDSVSLDELISHEKSHNAEELNAFGGNLLGRKPMLAYPKAARKRALDVLDLIEQGFFCKSEGALKRANTTFHDKMKDQSEEILGYINDFSWTIDWDSRDYHPTSHYGCSGAKKTGKTPKESFKADKKRKRTLDCSHGRNHGFGKGQFTGQLKLGK